MSKPLLFVMWTTMALIAQTPKIHSNIFSDHYRLALHEVDHLTINKNVDDKTKKC